MRLEVLLTILTLACACSSRTINLASSADAGRTDSGESVLEDGGSREGGPSFDDAGKALCGTRQCQCSNGIDDADDDTKADSEDPECTGPFDDSEADFGTGVPQETSSPKCQNCFYSYSQGKDACQRPTECLTNPGARVQGMCRECAVGDACRNSCQGLTPNGCDCFGCCEVRRNGVVARRIQLTPSCSMKNLDDPLACKSCELARDCYNECGPCESCPGKELVDLPDSCGDNQFSCEDGGLTCGPTRGCGADAYCLWGCCVPYLI